MKAKKIEVDFDVGEDKEDFSDELIADFDGMEKNEVTLAVEPEEPKPAPTAICDISGLGDDEKKMLVESRIGAIIRQSQIPFIPALVYYKESQYAPPLIAVVKTDHRFLMDAWAFYKTNVSEPQSKDFLDIIRKFTASPEDVYTRVVDVHLE